MDNQTNVDNEGVTLFLLAEGLVFLLSILRIFVVAVVLAVNVLALRSWNSSAQVAKCQCLQSYVSDSVKLCSVVYILSWTPFLFYSLLNGKWIFIDEHIFCLVQNYITNAVSMVLVALAALLAWHRARNPKQPQPRLSGSLTLAAWLLPQMIYFVVLTAFDSAETPSRLDFDFLDDLISSGNKTTGKSIAFGYKIGFTICGQMLCQVSLAQYIIQYFAVIAPPTLIAVVAFTIHKIKQCRNRCRANPYDNMSAIGNNQATEWCTCYIYGESPTLEIILSCNVIWMAALRPWIILTWPTDHLFVDLGSHLMLTIAAVFAPIMPSKVSITPAQQIDMVKLEDNKIGSSTA